MTTKREQLDDILAAAVDADTVVDTVTAAETTASAVEDPHAAHNPPPALDSCDPTTTESYQHEMNAVVDLDASTVPCTLCASAIPSYQAEYAELRPCGCKLCLKCLVNAHARRGTSLLTCCGVPVTGHQFLGVAGAPIGGEVQCVSYHPMESGEEQERGYAQVAKQGGETTTSGGKRQHKPCKYHITEGCTNGAVNNGVCFRHGATRKNCNHPGCTNGAKKGGVCVRHGAKKKTCSAEGCTNKAQKGGICIKHGANVQYKRCDREGCTNFAQRGGVCIRHGARHPTCKVENCTNQVQKAGVCTRHGANDRAGSGDRQAKASVTA